MEDCIDHGLRRYAAGYAYVYRDGKRQRLHRLVLADKLGIDISKLAGLVARHTCDNAWCINPEHLILGTQADNIADAVQRKRNARGTGNGQAKLDAEAVKYCREVFIPYHKEFGGAALARKFGVDCTVIHDAIKGNTWRDI